MLECCKRLGTFEGKECLLCVQMHELSKLFVGSGLIALVGGDWKAG